MPFYDYKCVACGSVQEEYHSIITEPEIKCSKCGKLCKRQMPTEMNFVLKGSGWASKEMKIKKDMTNKNKRAGTKSKEKEHYGEAVKNMDDLKKVS